MTWGTTTGMVALAVVAPVADTTPLAPAGGWVVEYADSMCVLGREYGVGDARVMVAFRPLPLGATAELVMLAPGEKTDAVRRGTARVTLLP